MKLLYILILTFVILPGHFFGQHSSVKSIKKLNVDNSVQNEYSQTKQPLDNSDYVRVKIQVPHLFNNQEVLPQKSKGMDFIIKVMENESKPMYPKNKSRQISIKPVQ